MKRLEEWNDDSLWVFIREFFYMIRKFRRNFTYQKWLYEQSEIEFLCIWGWWIKMKRLEEWNDDSLWVLLEFCIFLIRKFRRNLLIIWTLWAKRNRVFVYLGVMNNKDNIWVPKVRIVFKFLWKKFLNDKEISKKFYLSKATLWAKRNRVYVYLGVLNNNNNIWVPKVRIVFKFL
jgi:hypothetical protein